MPLVKSVTRVHLVARETEKYSLLPGRLPHSTERGYYYWGGKDKGIFVQASKSLCQGL